GYPSENGSILDILETTADIDSFTEIFGKELDIRYPQAKNWRISYPPKTGGEPCTRSLSALFMELTPNIFSYCENYKLSLPME
nr:hypothetical protein [Bacteroidales bacterium]